MRVIVEQVSAVITCAVIVLNLAYPERVASFCTAHTLLSLLIVLPVAVTVGGIVRHIIRVRYRL